MLTVLTVEEARQKVLDNVNVISRTEQLEINRALGRVTGETVRSPENFPPFDRATMDGFAVRAADTFGAAENMPAFLTLKGEILMGQEPSQPLHEGQAMSIATGGMLPQGADAVVMVEYTEKLAPGELAVYRPVAPKENILTRGEDYRETEGLLHAGHRLRPQDLGVLAGLGVTAVTVRPRPRVMIISTGDEIVPCHTKPAPGQIRDINSTVLSAQVLQSGGAPHLTGIIGDRQEALQKALAEALEQGDIVIISGGSSVGMRDVSSRVIEEQADGGLLFHGVSMRPGKPLIFGCHDGKPIFGLSGNPVSAMVGFLLFVRPAIYKLQGLVVGDEYPRTVQAKLSRRLPSASGREDYVRVKLERHNNELQAVPLFGQAGLMKTVIQGEGLVRIDRNQEGYEEGEIVTVYLFE